MFALYRHSTSGIFSSQTRWTMSFFMVRQGFYPFLSQHPVYKHSTVCTGDQICSIEDLRGRAFQTIQILLTVAGCQKFPRCCAQAWAWRARLPPKPVTRFYQYLLTSGEAIDWYRSTIDWYRLVSNLEVELHRTCPTEKSKAARGKRTLEQRSVCPSSDDDEDVYYPKGRRPREDEGGEESYEKQHPQPEV